MKILAIESSSAVASVAIVEDDKLIGEYTINHKITHSQTLMPMLDELVKRVELDKNDLDAIAVAAGPGSFTGLRIGSATVKGIAYALDIPVIPVKTLEGLAYNMWGTQDLVCPIMDARRNQTFTGLYEFKDGELCTLKDQCVVDIAEIVGEINKGNRPVIFVGDGIYAFKNVIADNIQVPYSFAPAHKNAANAATVAAYAEVLYNKGIYQSAAEHKPEYLRLSQAERERLKAGKSLE